MKTSNNIGAKFMIWILFGVIIALLPFAIYSLMLRTNGTVPTLVYLLSDGELLLVSSAIASGAVGELIVSRNKRNIIKILVGFLCVCVIGLASAWYGVISIQAGVDSLDAEFITSGSIYMFIFSVISSGGCIIIAGLE